MMEPQEPNRQESFADALSEQIRNTPWILLSLVIHVVLAMVLNLLSTEAPRRAVIMPLEASAAAEEDSEPVPEDEPEKKDEIRDDAESNVEEDAPVDVNDDPPELDTEDPFDDTKGEDQSSIQPLDDCYRRRIELDGLLPRLALAQPQGAAFEVHFVPSEVQDLTKPTAGEDKQTDRRDHGRTLGLLTFRATKRLAKLR